MKPSFEFTASFKPDGRRELDNYRFYDGYIESRGMEPELCHTAWTIIHLNSRIAEDRLNRR